MPLAKVTPHQSRLPRTNCTCKTPPSGSAAWSHHRNTPNLSRNPEHDSETRPVLSAPFCVVLHIYVCRTILPNIHFHTSRKDENSCGAVVARRSYKIRQTLMAFHLVMRMPWVRVSFTARMTSRARTNHHRPHQDYIPFLFALFLSL